MKTEEANEFYNKFLDKLRESYKPEKIKGKYFYMSYLEFKYLLFY